MIGNRLGEFLLGGLVCVLTAYRAWAVEVYLNGVRITGVKDQIIEKAKVVVDRDGNVYITAPEYKVRELDGTRLDGKPATGAPVIMQALAKNYYLVTEVTRLGMTGYSVQVMINSKLIKVLSDNLSQHVLELNPYLHKGINTVSFRAIRSAVQNGLVKKTLSSDGITLVLGEGTGRKGGTLRIDNILAEFKVTNADGQEKSKTFTIEAR